MASVSASSPITQIPCPGCRGEACLALVGNGPGGRGGDKEIGTNQYDGISRRSQQGQLLRVVCCASTANKLASSAGISLRAQSQSRTSNREFPRSASSVASLPPSVSPDPALAVILGIILCQEPRPMPAPRQHSSRPGLPPPPASS